MGHDYAFIHLLYTVPPATALTLIYSPLFTRLDAYKLVLLITIAVLATTPWDSFLIRRGIWTYPSEAVMGITLLQIPVEEYFFFIIQTYTTSLLYYILTRPVLHVMFLSSESYESPPNGSALIRLSLKKLRRIGQLILLLIFSVGIQMVKSGKEFMYLGLIVVWASPFLFLLWSLSYQFIIGLPLSSTLIPIAVPTLYLWIVDTVALRRGTWVIQDGTKVGFHLWDGLEIEEALFFLLTNILVVLGQIAFDNALAVIEAFPALYPEPSSLPSPVFLTKALLVPVSSYDEERLEAIRQAMLRLKVKSHSFYLASGMFRGRLRIDLVLLYSFCRAADDLIDNAQSRALANNWISILTRYLDIAYDTTRTSDDSRQLQQFVINNFPSSIHSTLFYLPTAYLDPKPFHELIQGFKTDIDFISPQGFPIRVEDDLHLYASRVAGTVADLCLQLVFHHTRQNFSKAQRHRCVQAGMLMGNALQLVNVARDVVIDAQIGRVYLPLSWLQEIGITPEMVIRNPDSESVKALRHNLLRVAFDIYMGSRSVIEELPKEARGPMRVAVEQYMEIGRVLQERNCRAPSIVLVMAEKEARKTALVVGAGIGGVSTAARLAKAGFSVTILEKNEFAGGRCSLLHHHDWRFDQGPSLLLLPRLFEETFQDLDTSLEDEGVHLLKCEPNYKLWFGDGESIELSTDLARMKSEVEKWEGKDGFERYLRFLQEAHRHYEISVEQVLKKNFTSIFSMARPTFLRHLLDLHPFESIYTRASKYFWTERLRRAFTFASMYMGMSPFDAPGTYSLLQYTEIAEGIWYPEGGFHRVVDALVNVGKRLGVEYRLSTTVDKIKLSSPNFSDNRHAQGVILASGEELLADVVVVNADLVYAYKNLLPPSSLAESLQKRPASCSSISFYWALNRKLPELHTHNIFLADDYKESFDDIFKHQLIPKQPSFYVNVPSRIDPTAAPNGKESVIVLVPVGHLLDKQEGICVDLSTTQDWDGMVDKARETIISTIQARTGARKLKEATVNEFINTPLTWKPKFNLDKGAILGLSHSFFNILSFRPKTKHPRIGNLYFVGASTHPGTGVPICLAGSRITTEQILEEFKLTASWLRKRANVKVAQKSIDKVRIYPLGSNLQITLLILLIALLGAIIQSWELKGFGYGW